MVRTSTAQPCLYRRTPVSSFGMRRVIFPPTTPASPAPPFFSSRDGPVRVHRRAGCAGRFAGTQLQIDRELREPNERLQQVWAASQLGKIPSDLVPQCIKIRRGVIREPPVLDVAPDPVSRVQLRGMRGEGLHGDVRALGNVSLHLLALVNRDSVPDDGHWGLERRA